MSETVPAVPMAIRAFRSACDVCATDDKSHVVQGAAFGLGGGS